MLHFTFEKKRKPSSKALHRQTQSAVIRKRMQSKPLPSSGNAKIVKPATFFSRQVRLPCRYSHQLTKKRKTWQDGRLLVSMATGDLWSASLFDVNDCRGVPLEMRPLEPAEVKRLKSRQEIQIHMEKNIIDVSFGGSHENYEPPLKLAKFKPPSAIIPSVRNNIQPESEIEVQTSNNRLYSDRGSYNVTDSELDEIWGPKPIEPPTTSVVPQPRPRPVPRPQQEPECVNEQSSRPIQASASQFLSNHQRVANHQPIAAASANVLKHGNDSSNGNSAVRGSMLRVSSSIWD